MKCRFRNTGQLRQHSVSRQHILAIFPRTWILLIIRRGLRNRRSILFSRSGIEHVLQITLCLHFILYSNAHYGTRMSVSRIFGLKQTGYNILSRIFFHKIHPFFIPLLDIVRISSFSILLSRSKIEYGFQVRNGPLVVRRKLKTGERSPPNPIIGFCLRKSIDKSSG